MHSGFPKEYEQLSSLGEGGMGTVYLAKQKAFDRLVAVKVLKAELASQVSDRKRFLREAKFCAQIEDPNILGIIDSGIVQGIPYIVMEYVDGPNLQDLLKQGIDLNKGLEIIKQVASALLAAHRKKIVHRDLKPENVLIAKDGTVRVADWGISRALMDVEQLTKTGIVLGTPQYMAPEQILAQNIGPPCDLYSLGVMLFQVLTGRLPFQEENLTDLLQAHLKRQPPKVEQFSPQIPSQLSKLVNSLLVKEPQQRPTAKDVLQRLSKVNSVSTQDIKVQTVACAILTLETKESNTKSKARAPIFIALLLGIVALFLLNKTAGKPKKATVPFAVKMVALKAPNELSFRYVGNSYQSYQLKVVPNCAPTFSTKVDFSKARGRATGSNVMSIKLPQPIIDKAEIYFEPADISKAEVSVEPLFQEALEPVFSLHKKRLDDFISVLTRECLKLRSYMKRIRELEDKEKAERLWVAGHEKLTPHYERVLADFNITKNNMARLKKLLQMSDGCRAYANNKLRRKMAPLRMVEALLGEGGLVTLPWGNSQPISAIEIKSKSEVRDFLTKSKMLGKLNLVKMVSREDGPPRKSYCWIADKRFFSKFRNQGIANLAYAALANDTNDNKFIRSVLKLSDDENFPEIEEIGYEFKSELEIEGEGKVWPPKESWLLITTRGLSREMELIIELNEQRYCGVMYVTSGFDPFELKTHRYHSVLIRLSPTALSLGKNQLRIYAQSFPTLEAKGVIALLEIGAYALFE